MPAYELGSRECRLCGRIRASGIQDQHSRRNAAYGKEQAHLLHENGNRSELKEENLPSDLADIEGLLPQRKLRYHSIFPSTEARQDTKIIERKIPTSLNHNA